jgi:hypothetical protein
MRSHLFEVVWTVSHPYLDYPLGGKLYGKRDGLITALGNTGSCLQGIFVIKKVL